MRSLLISLAVLVIPLVFAAEKDAARKLAGRIDRELTKLDKLRSGARKSEAGMLMKQADQLLLAARASIGDLYKGDRLVEAAGDLLDAIEELDPPRKGRDEDDDDSEEERRSQVARRLERTYFRLQQASYFARQSGRAGTGDLVSIAKRLYQSARNAYDDGKLKESNRQAEACGETVNALEKLAQAEVRIPVPPRLNSSP